MTSSSRLPSWPLVLNLQSKWACQRNNPSLACATPSSPTCTQLIHLRGDGGWEGPEENKEKLESTVEESKSTNLVLHVLLFQVPPVCNWYTLEGMMDGEKGCRAVMKCKLENRRIEARVQDFDRRWLNRRIPWCLRRFCQVLVKSRNWEIWISLRKGSFCPHFDSNPIVLPCVFQ